MTLGVVIPSAPFRLFTLIAWMIPIVYVTIVKLSWCHTEPTLICDSWCGLKFEASLLTCTIVISVYISFFYKYYLLYVPCSLGGTLHFRDTLGFCVFLLPMEYVEE